MTYDPSKRAYWEDELQRHAGPPAGATSGHTVCQIEKDAPCARVQVVPVSQTQAKEVQVLRNKGEVPHMVIRKPRQPNRDELTESKASTGILDGALALIERFRERF